MGARVGSKLTLTRWSFSTAATAGRRWPLTATGPAARAHRRRWRRSGDQGGGSNGARASDVWRNFQPHGPLGIYTHSLSVAPSGTNRWHRDVQLLAVTATRWDRVGLIGSTEMKNLDQSKGFQFDRVWVGWSDQNQLEGFGRQPLSDRWLRVLLTRRVRKWLVQFLWCSKNRIWDKKA